jgi:hypothetical protein
MGFAQVATAWNQLALSGRWLPMAAFLGIPRRHPAQIFDQLSSSLISKK